MAFADLGQIAAGGNTTNNVASLTVATTASVAAGQLVVVAVAVDNRISGGGDDLSTSGVTIGGVALTKGLQYATNLAAQAGSSVSIWYGVMSGTIASGANIIASFTTNTTCDAQCLSARKFSFSGSNTIAIEGTNTAVGTTTTPGSCNVLTTNREFLRVRAIGCEYDSTQTLTGTASWTVWTEAASAATGTVAEQCLEVESRIVTSTGTASNPTLGAACDSASAYIAFKEDVTGTGAASAQSAAASGAGASGSTGTGAVVGQSADADGVGIVTAAGISGIGAVAAQAADADGIGVSSSVAVGAASAQVSGVAGVGVSHTTGIGALSSQVAFVASVGVSGSVGVGAAASQVARVSGGEAMPVVPRTGRSGFTGDKVVTYDSPEFYRLQGLGYRVLDFVSRTKVNMRRM